MKPETRNQTEKLQMMLNKGNRTWLVVANSSKVSIYEWNPDKKQLREIISLNDNEARMPERDLRADRPGYGQGFNSKVQYTVDEHTSYKEQASKIFLKKIATILCDDDNFLDYDELVMIAQDHVNKIIQENMSVNGRKKITHHYPKNLTNMPMLELQKYYTNQLN